jgi:hypothetical protein
VLEDDPLVLLFVVARLGQLAGEVVDLGVGNDLAFVEAGDQPPVGGSIGAPAVGVRMVGMGPQVVLASGLAIGERATQVAQLPVAESEGDGIAVRRIGISHEERNLLLVRRPACVTAQRVAALGGMQKVPPGGEL